MLAKLQVMTAVIVPAKLQVRTAVTMATHSVPLNQLLHHHREHLLHRAYVGVRHMRDQHPLNPMLHQHIPSARRRQQSQADNEKVNQKVNQK